MKSLLSITDLSAEDIHNIVQLAMDMKAHPQHYTKSLAGKHCVMLFEKPSLRTRASFEVGLQQLGMSTHFFDMQHDKMGARESVKDLANNLSQWYDAVVARVDCHDSLVQLKSHGNLPVINALCDRFHPCQALADFLTMAEMSSLKEGVHLGYVGDFNNVCSSLIHVAALLNVSMTVVSPSCNQAQFDLIETAKSASNASLQWCSSVEQLKEVDFIYTDVWQSMGAKNSLDDIEATYLPYQVNHRLMQQTNARFFMHCQPVHRGQEATSEVCDGSNSLMYQQAANRMHVQKALLYWIFNGAHS
ncbi:ornithine carbamoyltransferase [Pleionea sp. CnH1-48]|uniref:ornithine carbamoyltransferase n=1 Tax=Pleionea sp. CnH1-48 TaxID=2954494 RepID=UPI00209818EC|nr:ornithine carbamoyltransferase [Pleionea sp. CnH1-48]MCO7224451.1 ornithine carbamoyltransferase [Pleionea sp. CnH1-48]